MRISARERRLLVLLGLVAAVAAFRLLWLVASPPAPRAVATAGSARTAARGVRGARAATEAPTTVVLLRTDRLDAASGDFEVGRDLFRFGPPLEPPPPPPPTAAELEQMRQLALERRAAAEEAALEAAKPKPPAVTLRYLGCFGPAEGRIAVFTDAAGQSVWNARIGDVVDGKFIVDKIGIESVDLKFVGFEDLPPTRLAAGE